MNGYKYILENIYTYLYACLPIYTHLYGLYQNIGIEMIKINLI